MGWAYKRRVCTYLRGGWRHGSCKDWKRTAPRDYAEKGWKIYRQIQVFGRYLYGLRKDRGRNTRKAG